MKKNIIRMIISIAVFFLTMFITSSIMNEGKSDLTVEMREATLPVVSVVTKDGNINEMYGYTMDMESEYIRDCITQIDYSRKIALKIDVKKAPIQNIFYELRSLTGERLIEKKEFIDFEEKKGAINLGFTIKDLIEPEKEYVFILVISLEDGRTVNYYTRIIQTDSFQTNEKIKFVKEFSDKTFDKEKALELTKYLESNYEGDNTTFHKTNIHSSFFQITWGDLNLERVDQPKVRILELQEETGSIEITYSLKEKTKNDPKSYFVKENFRVRYTTNRMYLLDYERTMEEEFVFNEKAFINNKCILGITSENINVLENDGGEIFTFVNNNQLYSIMPEENKVVRIFGYYETVSDDTRNMNRNHKIKPLNCDEAGNIYFIVYGYHNRGMYEGKVGIQVYYYDSNLNTIEEKVFISYTKSSELLIYEVNQLTYLSKSGVLYLLMDNVLLSIDVQIGKIEELTDPLMEGSFTVSNSNETVAWLEGKSLYNSKKLTLINLNTKESHTINATSGTNVLPLGFMGEDLIYGEAYTKDIIVNSAGNTIFPMYRIYIKDEKGETLKSYEKEKYFIVNCSIVDNQINLKRVTWDENEMIYLDTTEDQIVNNIILKKGENIIEKVITQTYEKRIQIFIKEKIKDHKLLFLTPKEVLYEGNRKIEKKPKEDAEEKFYVYVQGHIDYVSNVSGKAILYAEENAGTVVNDYGKYVWYAGNRFVKNQIMSIKEKEITAEKNALVVCLETILEREGLTRNCEEDIERGKFVFEILEKQLPSKQILDLTGCSLESVLHYVNKDIPVFVLIDETEAVLITGFNDLQVVVFSPSSGTLYKMGKKAASSWFEKSGSVYISYIERKD